MAWQYIGVRDSAGTEKYVAGAGSAASAGATSGNPLLPLHTVVLDSQSIGNGGLIVSPTFLKVDTASSGDTSLVAAVASTKQRVMAMWLMAAGTVSIYFTSAAGGTVIFGGSTNKIAMAAQTPVILPYSPVGWFETASNQALVINLSAAIAVSGGLVYTGIA